MDSKAFFYLLLQAVKMLLVSVLKVIALVLSWVFHLLGSLLLWLSSITVKLAK